MPLVCPKITKFHELPRIVGYYYLGSPYSKYPDGIQAAFIDICRVAGGFAKCGISVYSPIAHTHSIARVCDIDPFDHKVWLPFDEPMMAAADGMIVGMLKSWDISFGIEEEIKFFEKEGSPIYYMEFNT